MENTLYYQCRIDFTKNSHYYLKNGYFSRNNNFALENLLCWYQFHGTFSFNRKIVDNRSNFTPIPKIFFSTYRPVRFVRFNDLDRLTISDKNCLGITKPSGINCFSTNKCANCCGSTTITLQQKSKHVNKNYKHHTQQN